MLVLDLDRFKLVNDSLGHRAGDELLNEVARRLSGLVQRASTRWRASGGDEFVLVVGPAASAPGRRAASRAGRSRRCRRRSASRASTCTSLRSIGIAFYPADGGSAETLIAHADAAMYCAKQRGRNSLQCFEPGMDTVTRERVKLESELHEALGAEAVRAALPAQSGCHDRTTSTAPKR